MRNKERVLRTALDTPSTVPLFIVGAPSEKRAREASPAPLQERPPQTKTARKGEQRVDQLSTEAISYLLPLAEKRSQRLVASKLGMLELASALADTACVLVHDDTTSSSPLASLREQAGPNGICLVFPHGRKNIVLYVWQEEAALMSIALTEEEISFLSSLPED